MKKYTTFLSFLSLVALSLLLWQCNMGSADSVSPNQNGTGGSMARFAITGNTLYIVTRQSLDVYDITQPDAPTRQAKAELGLGIETIFPYRQNLFVGANDGMYIFNNQQPQAPTLLSKYTHVMSCDPVVVQNQYAYVTLRGGVGCRQWVNNSSLDVVDVSDPANPKLINSQPMQSPYGLGVDGDKLFVCEGISGLKVFDISDPTQPRLHHNYPEVASYDVIPRQNLLIVTGQNGLYQYRYGDNIAENSMELLSKIPVE
ncbi:hypothetical protein GCM10027275_38320 [Rhabdobacter roseus]|uniref:LVIVD repeat-containing protein n=1 Tax=Rhabdobacter roseus TaxID=1655419 RepID=A0A840U0U6_9BACT|nr:hypothetical protein [Rhabdobacter roseus]MBB5285760.1 hypothetical protein [Rhabdobacter roseus]